MHCRRFLLACLSLWLTPLVADDLDVRAYLNTHAGNGALFSGVISDHLPITAVLWLGGDGNRLDGYYFHTPDASLAELYSQLQAVPVSGELHEDEDAVLVIRLQESPTSDQPAGRLEARFSASAGVFKGQWVAETEQREHDFRLSPGGMLTVNTEPHVVLDISPAGHALVIDGDTRLEGRGYQFESIEYPDWQYEQTFGVLDGDPAIFVLGSHYHGGRVPSSDLSYIVKGSDKPFLSANDGGGHWCAGGTGGRQSHDINYDPPRFTVSFTQLSWDHCNTSNGYYYSSDYWMQQVYKTGLGVETLATLLPEETERRQSLTLIRKEGESILLELTDDQLLWQAALIPEGANFAQSPMMPDDEPLCWLYGSGRTQPGVPSTSSIDPAWRNLDHATSWQYFVQRTHNGLMSKEVWSISEQQGLFRLKLNDTEVARYDSETDQCYSLYLKERSAGVEPLASAQN